MGVDNRFPQLERLPRERELHHWADYAEINCFASADGLYSRGQLSSQIRQGRDTGEAVEASTQGEAVLNDQMLDSLLGINDSGDLALSSGEPSWDSDFDSTTSDEGVHLDNATVADGLGRRVDDIWRHLQYREKAFGDNWPFALEPMTQALTIASDLTEAQRIYLFLLECSLLRYQDRTTRGSLTRVFELVAHQAFLSAFSGWEVHVFGTAAPGNTRFFHGKLWDRLVALAADLRTPLLVREDEVSAQNSGDNGLDLVAWLPLPEKSKGLPIAFAQCACGASDWKDKQGEASEQRWGETMRLSSPVQNWLFIPFCYHDPQGDWETPFSVHNGVLVDRLRIFKLLEPRLSEVGALVAGIRRIN
jgi:hypothetical protein